MCLSILKTKIRLKREVSTAFVFSPQRKGGMGILHPGEAADSALLTEFTIHMNSRRHEDIKVLMRSNYRKVGTIVGPDFLTVGRGNKWAGGVSKITWTMSYMVWQALDRIGWKLRRKGHTPNIEEYLKQRNLRETEGTGGKIKKGDVVFVEDWGEAGDEPVESVMKLAEAMYVNGPDKTKRLTNMTGAWYPLLKAKGDEENVFGVKNELEEPIRDNYIQPSTILQEKERMKGRLDEREQVKVDAKVARKICQQWDCNKEEAIWEYIEKDDEGEDKVEGAWEVEEIKDATQVPGITQENLWKQKIVEGVMVYKAKMDKVPWAIAVGKVKGGKRIMQNLITYELKGKIPVNKVVKMGEHEADKETIKEMIQRTQG
jgi:hypothetical protein